MLSKLLYFIIFILIGINSNAQDFEPLKVSDNESIQLNTYPNGDRIPDYSYCGYKMGEVMMPDILNDESVPVIRFSSREGDRSYEIQAAIDYAAELPLNDKGFRAVIYFENGEYDIYGSLKISASGIVLRGQGNGTILKACGTTRETLIKIRGQEEKFSDERIQLSCEYLPVNSVEIPLESAENIKVGDRIRITRPSTKEWFQMLGTHRIGAYGGYNFSAWTSGDFDLHFDRYVTEVHTKSIVVDVPIPQSFESLYGGAYVQLSLGDDRINNVAIENMSIVSEYDKAYPKDEDHRWMAIVVDNANDCWFRRIDVKHFVSSAIYLLPNASRITVQECSCTEPVGEIGGYRRIAFQTLGQMTLFNRCYSEEGWHDFAVGPTTAGPNAFIQCHAVNSHSFSGALGGWSCGTLFDRVTVEGAPIKFSYIDLDLQGGGWSSANSLCWQCRAPQIHLSNPPGTYNWGYGSKGQGYGNGSHSRHRIIRPEYFYLSQFKARTGRMPEEELDKVISYNPEFSQTDASFSAKQNARGLEPAWTIKRWNDTLKVKYPLAETPKGRILNLSFDTKAKTKKTDEKPLEYKEGRIAINGRYLAGRASRTALWRGTLRPSAVQSAGIHLTRFVPGRDGRGFTDEMENIASELKERRIAVFSHFPSLWYERRRDDHGRLKRADADVWAPFYEQPFARSGKGEAFDRLSLYDLNRWNKWYWSRIAAMSAIASEVGVAFVHEHYLQHNIIEEGAHWVDYPWRDANNINKFGFVEPTYMQGDKRVFMADQFYNLNNEKLREYHKRYIRKSLDEIKDGNNVIHHIGVEYTGPAEFMRFWLTTIIEWEKENNCDVKVALNATRDVTEEILGDTKLADAVDVIDIRHWYYKTDGTMYNPVGGVSLAPRQYARIMDTGQTDDECVWRIVREYRERFKEKAVWLNNTRSKSASWIAFLAGASLCSIPSEIAAPRFYTNVMKMSPINGVDKAMGKAGVGYVVYSSDRNLEIDLSSDKCSYHLQWIDPVSGESIGRSIKVKGGKVLNLEAPLAPAVAYLR